MTFPVAFLAAYPAGVYPGALHETYPEVGLAAYLDASSADEACEEMHDKMAQSCLTPVSPYYNPSHCHTAVEAECGHYKRDEESRDGETHGEEIHDGT